MTIRSRFYILLKAVQRKTIVRTCTHYLSLKKDAKKNCKSIDNWIDWLYTFQCSPETLETKRCRELHLNVANKVHWKKFYKKCWQRTCEIIYLLLRVEEFFHSRVYQKHLKSFTKVLTLILYVRYNIKRTPKSVQDKLGLWKLNRTSQFEFNVIVLIINIIIKQFI